MKKIIKGSTVVIQSNVYLDQNELYAANLTGATVTVLFKKNPRDTDAQALLTKSVGSGVSLTLPLEGILKTLLLASDTNTLSFTVLYYEVLVKLVGDVYIRSGVQEIQLLPNNIKILN